MTKNLQWHSPGKRPCRVKPAAIGAMLLVVGSGLAQAETKRVDIGTANATSTFVPISLAYNESWSECVYTEDLLKEIPEGSTIKSVSFEGVCSAGSDNVSYSVYMRNSNATSAPDKSVPKSDLSDYTCVYTGTIDVSVSENTGVAGPILTIDTQNDFVYEGGSVNVIVTADCPGDGSILFYANSVSKGCYLSLKQDAWEKGNTYNYNYVPVMHLDIELPANYVELQTATIGGTEYSSYYSAPVSFNDKYTMSNSLYTAEQLGMEAGAQISKISYRGFVSTTSDKPRQIRVWMKNTTESTVATGVPAVSTMTKVIDTSVIYDSKIGTASNMAELLKLKLDVPFTYTGASLLVYVESESEGTQRVYFCNNMQFPGQCMFGTGDDNDFATFTCSESQLPTTNFYYSVPAEEVQPDIELVTSREPGQKFGFLVCTENSGVRVDWGGKMSEYPYGGFLTLSHDLVGQEVKVYAMNPGDPITQFTCTSSDLTTVTLNAPGLKMLSLKDNHLENIDLTNCPAIEMLDLSGNNFFEFTLDSPTVKKLYLSKCSMEQLVLTGCTGLETLDVSVNTLRYPTWLFWPEAPGMQELNISFNQILEFDLSLYPNLRKLTCNHNNFTQLDLGAVPGLELLRSGYTGVTQLDLYKCPGLKVLDMTGAQVADNLNLTRVPALEELEMSLSGVTNIDLSANTELRRLVLSRNTLTRIDLSANTKLEHVDLGRNSISVLDVDGLGALRFLDVSRNGISTLDLTANAATDTLYCAINNLTELPLSANSKLRCLDLSSNSFAELPAGLNSIVYLNCSDNALTSVDLKDAVGLLGLDIHSNRLDKDALTALFRQLPDINGIDSLPEEASWKGVLDYSDNPGASEVSSAVPETKGWNCNYRPDILGDANAAMRIPADKVYTRFSFAIDTPDAVYYVDWGDGQKEEFRTADPAYSYNSIVGYALGDIVRIYAPSAIELGVCNAGYEDVDVSGMAELKRLSCTGNNLYSLDLTANTELEELICRENPLTSVTFAENCVLTDFDCSSTLLRDLDLTRTPQLLRLAANDCRLESIDLSAASALKEARLGNNGLDAVDLTSLPDLTDLYLYGNNLTSVDVSKNAKLEVLSLDYNKLATADITMLADLREAYLNNNELKTVKLKNPVMKVLMLGNNRLEDVDLSECPSITTVTLNNNRLSEVDFSNNRALVQIFAGDNQLNELTFAASMPALTLLNAENNYLTSVSTASLPALRELVITHNRVSGELDLSKCGSLTYMNIAHNEIGGFKWGTTSTVQTIYGAYNKLNVLNVPGTSLSVVDLSRNELEAVNFTNHSNLYYCVLDFNKLTTLNVSGKSNLTGLSIRANDFGAAAIQQICSQLPDVTDLDVMPGEESWMGYFFISGNPGAKTADVTAATQKGWRVVSNETMPIDRVLTLAIVDNEGTPVEHATLTLLVFNQAVGTQSVETAPGVYTYDPLPVFDGYTYGVRIDKEGFKTKTVDVSDIVGGNIDMEVRLERDDDGVDTVSEDTLKVEGLTGSIRITLNTETEVLVHDISGRPVRSVFCPAGETIIDNIEPGIYITLGHKVRVR